LIRAHSCDAPAVEAHRSGIETSIDLVSGSAARYREPRVDIARGSRWCDGKARIDILFGRRIEECLVTLSFPSLAFLFDVVWRPQVPASEIITHKAGGIDLAVGHGCSPSDMTVRSAFV